MSALVHTYEFPVRKSVTQGRTRCHPRDSSFRLVTSSQNANPGARCVRGLGSRTAPKDAA
jgi:hypothetical protein